MPELPAMKVGLVACSGEEIAAGTVTRLAALKVLEQLRPAQTVTICLPLFLAGGEGDRAFARFYPTITVDGCDKRCAARATEAFSNKPAVSLVVTDLPGTHGLLGPAGRRRPTTAVLEAAQLTASQIAAAVDTLLGQRWSRRAGELADPDGISLGLAAPKQAACSCGSGLPVDTLHVGGRDVELFGLSELFQQFRAAGRRPSAATTAELLAKLKIYNPIPAQYEAAYCDAIKQRYNTFWGSREPNA